MGQAQSFEMDHAQLDNIHLLQQKKLCLSLLFPHILPTAAVTRNTTQIDIPNSFWTVAGVFGGKTDVWSSICNQYNRSSQRASVARAAWLRQL